MRFSLQKVLRVATIASAAVLPPSLPLDLVSNPTFLSQPSIATITPSLLQIPTTTDLTLPFSALPDENFKLRLITSAVLVPIDSTLMNALYFMSIIASQNYTERLQPRSYSAPAYRDVKVMNFAWTEPRFLLWAMYEAIDYMVRFARFHDATLELWFEGNVVGRMRIASAKRGSSSAGEMMTQDHVLPQSSNLTDGEEGTTTTESKSAALLENATLSDLPPALASNASAALPNSPDFTIEFVDVVGAQAISRNNIFLTFYAAFLHVGQFPAERQMVDFESKSPNKVISLHIQELGPGCSYGILTNVLLYVPQYMLEHRENFGYRETEFVVSVDGNKACVGTVIKGLAEAERRSLAG